MSEHDFQKKSRPMLSCALGLRQPKLDDEMRAFFRDARPWAFILFREACVSRGQVRELCDDLRDTGGQALPRWQVEELVGAVGVRAGAQDARDEELRLRELRAEHRHERYCATFAHKGGLAAEVGARRRVY